MPPPRPAKSGREGTPPWGYQDQTWSSFGPIWKQGEGTDVNYGISPPQEHNGIYVYIYVAFYGCQPLNVYQLRAWNAWSLYLCMYVYKLALNWNIEKRKSSLRSWAAFTTGAALVRVLSMSTIFRRCICGLCCVGGREGWW